MQGEWHAYKEPYIFGTISPAVLPLPLSRVGHSLLSVADRVNSSHSRHYDRPDPR